MNSIKLDKVLDFFATVAELTDWIVNWITEHQLSAVAVTRSPFFILTDINWTDAQAVARILLSYDEILFCVNSILLTASNYSEFIDANQNCLELYVPRQTPTALRAAGIGSLTKDKPSLKHWVSIANDVLARTNSGMWMLNPATNAKGYYQRLRYSLGAATSQESGIKLLTFAAETPVFVKEP